MTPEKRRSICVTTAAIVAFVAAVTVRVVFQETFAPRIFNRVLVEESRSKEKCEADANRIFVTTELGSECVAYFVTKGFETRRQAVMFFDGDVSQQQYLTPGLLEGYLAQQKRLMQVLADRLRVRYVYVSRLGLEGSSGNHGERRQPKETLVMNAVVDGLKTRLGLDDLALAGQSGGATIAAGLLTLGRKDVQCAVLGSGGMETVEVEYDSSIKRGYHPIKAVLARKFYDPSAHLATIGQREDRRIFALGDPRDSIVAFELQSQFVDDLNAAGHAAKLIEVEGKGPQHHDVELLALPVAGACLNGVTDESIIRAVARDQSPSQALAQLGWQNKKLKPGATGTKPSDPRTLGATLPHKLPGVELKVDPT